jgi:hypothetical protein
MKAIGLLILMMFISLVGNSQMSSCSPLPGLRPEFFTLDEQDLFVITEYKETEYQVFLDDDSLNLPANLSSINYYIDINGEADSSNVVDINYLYLQGYHDTANTSGELFYLLSMKNIPMGNRKTNIRSSKSVDLYSELSSIADISFGYWRIDPLTHRIFLVFREGTKIWNMNNFRIFVGLILNKNIYLTKAMNPKDAYLFDYNFRKNKELFVKLPLSLDRVFYSEPVKTEDAEWIEGCTLSRKDAQRLKEGKEVDKVKNGVELSRKMKKLDWSRTGSEETPRDRKIIYQNKVTVPVKDYIKNDETFSAAIKYSYYPYSKADFDRKKIERLNYDVLSFSFMKKKNGKKDSKYVLFKGRRGDLFTYARMNLKQYKKYYSEHNQKEFIFIHIIDPYDEKATQTFTIPYSGESFIPMIIHFFRKKILDAQ